MTSARDRLKAANLNIINDDKEARKNTIVTSLLDNFNEHEEKSSSKPAKSKKRNIEQEINEIASQIKESDLTAPILEAKKEEKKAGRPVVYTEKFKTVTIRLTESNYLFAKKNGWDCGGYTGYINKLIEEKRNQ